MPSPAPRRVRAVVLQPLWRPEHYRSEAAFRAWLHRLLEEARPHLAPDCPTLVALPELNGLPLLLLGAPLAARAGTFERALAVVLARHLPAVLAVAARERVGVARAIQLALAHRTALVYLRAMGDLAHEFEVYLVSGSVPLPRFERRGGRTLPRGPEVFNTAFVFGPDGALLGTADKVRLTTLEGAGGLDLTPGRLDELRVLPTPAGDLGVAVCFDAFQPDVIARLEAGGATVLVQPSANGAPWTVKEGEGPMKGVRDQPPGWREGAWRAVQGSRTLRYALNPMAVGNLLGVPFDGQSAIVARPEEAPAPGGYVMTDAAPGFLGVMEWVHAGDHDELRRVGRELAPGGARENAYRTGALAADLDLPPLSAAPPPLRPHEAALADALSGRARLAPHPAARLAGGALVLGLGVGVGLAALLALLRSRRRLR